MEEAEKMKLDIARERPLDEISSKKGENKVWRVVQPLLDELIREIRRSVDYYQSQFPETSADAHVSKIVLTGGSARMPGMDAYVASKLKIPTMIAEVFKQTAIGAQKVPEKFVEDHGPVLAVGMGLALKELIPEVRQMKAAA